MGGVFVDIVLDGNLSQDEVRTAFEHQKDQDGWEHGHSYSGSFSEFYDMSFSNQQPFNTWDDANEWLQDNTNKGENAFAVRYHDITPTKTLQTHLTKHRELLLKHHKAGLIARAAIDRWRTSGRKAEPAYVGVAKERSERKQASIQVMIDARLSKINTINAKLAKKCKKTKWMVGGWAAS